MKFHAILLICCVIYYVDAQYCTGHRLKAVLAKCSIDEKATADDIEDILSQRKARNENAKCFRACFLKKCNVMDAVGNLVPNNYKDYLQLLSHGNADKKKIMESVLEKCVRTTKVGAKICTTAGDYMDCLFNNCKNCGWNLHSV